MTEIATSQAPPSIASQATTTKGEPVVFSWSGPVWGLAGLGLVNLLLTLVTLGVYHFWAKTEVRRRIMASVRINGEPMEYTGTGLELFLGFLIIFAIVLLPVLGLSLLAQFELGPQKAPLALLGIYPLFLYLAGVATYRARKYRRSRIRWRGIRGYMPPGGWRFGWTYFWTFLVLICSLFFAYPWRENKLHSLLINKGTWGDRGFSYSAKSGPLFPRYLLMIFSPYILMLGLGALAAIVYLILYALGIAPKSIPLPNPTPGSQAMIPDPGLGLGLAAAPTPNPPPAWAFAIVFAIYVPLILFVGFFWTYYRVKVLSYFAENTQFDNTRFKLEVGSWRLYWITYSSLILSALTLTILSPVAEARMARYLVSRLKATGTVDFADILQSQEKLGKTGEGMAEAFDVDASSSFILSI